jgi:hypothetical protein
MNRVAAAVLGLAFLAFACKNARAAEPAIAGVVLDTPASATTAPGFLVAVSPPAQRWLANSYYITIELKNAETGELLATSNRVAGESDVAAGQTAFVSVRFSAPLSVAGLISVLVRLEHDGRTVDENTQTAYAVGAVAAGAFDSAQSQAAKALSGEAGATAKFQARASRTFAVSLTQKLAPDRSLSIDTNQSTVPGYGTTLVRLQSPGQLFQAGSMYAEVSPLVLSGAQGIGMTAQQEFSPARSVKAIYLQGDPTTENPYNAAALTYTTPLGADVLSLTGGKVHASGAVDSFSTVFLRDGVFAAATLKFDRPAALSYQFDYATFAYFDEIAQRDRSDHAFAFQTAFPIAAFAWSADYSHTGTFYPTVTTPTLSPDHDDLHIGFRVPVGKLSFAGSAAGALDGLDGAFSPFQTVGWKEQADLGYSLAQNTAVSLRAIHSIDHSNGSVASSNSVDDVLLTYSTRRGDYAFGTAVGSVNTRNSGGTLVHAIRDAFSISRDVSDGLGFSAGYTLSNRQFNDATQTEIEGSGQSSITYTHSVFSLSATASRSLTRPFFGDTLAPLTQIDYSLRIRPAHAFPVGMLMTLGSTHGGNTSTYGSINVTRGL